MARTQLTVHGTDTDGSGDPTYTAAIADGFFFVNDGKLTYIVVKNGDASPHDVEVQIGRTVDGQQPPAKTISVGASEEEHIGGWNRADYNKGTNGNEVWIDFPVTTSMTVAVFKIGG
jgi:hypothetical protein